MKIRLITTFVLLCLIYGKGFGQVRNIIVPSAHDGKILKILIDDQNKYFYTADEWKVIMWEFNTNKQLFTFPISNKSVTQNFGNDIHNLRDMHLSPNSDLIAFTTEANELKIFSTQTGNFRFWHLSIWNLALVA